MTVRPPSPSRVAAPVAQAILDAFAGHRTRFRQVTRRAQGSFERRDWAGLRRDAKQRLGIHRSAVRDAETQIRVLLGDRAQDRLVWVSAKAVYSALIAQRHDWDLAETFFNGVTRRIFDTVGVDPLVEFVASDFDAPPLESSEESVRRYPTGAGRATTGATVVSLIDAVLGDTPFLAMWRDREEDARLAAERVEAKLVALDRGPPLALELISPVFYRGKGAYLVGRLVLPAGVVVPLVLAVRNGEDGLYLDAVLVEADDVSLLFSYTRSYFHVDAARPYDLMRFLRSLIPKKRIAELYIAIGEPKQGKTELYRAVVDHIDDSREVFGYAPGTPGLVMVVFTMPGLDVVVKIIRDRFPPQKSVTPSEVRERYQWVYTHDRAGRLVDAQEFEELAFEVSRFEPALLEELTTECAKTARVEGGRVVLERAYVERQIVPLNLYVRQREQEEAEAALEEWGRAIHDLAAENIFPGDLLLKNFGVTRQRRVALYDYDELTELSDVTFRVLPEARHDEDDLRAEPWFSVASGDIFPEEFPRFLGIPRRLRPCVMERCAHVFDPAWWRSMQARVEAGEIAEPAPYPEAGEIAEPAPYPEARRLRRAGQTNAANDAAIDGS